MASSLLKTMHHSSYPGISPSVQALSQRGRNVLITGAGSGIGRATALSFARAGATNIALIGRDVVKLNESRELIRSLDTDSKAYVLVVDVRDETALNSAFDKFASTINGPIHVLAAVAGVSPKLGMSTTVSPSTYLEGFQNNTMGVINTVQAYMKHLPPECNGNEFKGHIIHTSSGLAAYSFPTCSTYGVAKAASTKYMEAVALENPEVQVISYHPGTVETAMTRQIIAGGLNIPVTDDASLAADFTVWASSPESAFLGSGKVIWAGWDVDELREILTRFRNDTDAGGLSIQLSNADRLFTTGLIG